MILPPVVWAHVFVGDAGPAVGFMHPLTGPDHLLAMFSVGVLSAQIGGRAVWMVPAAFVTVMLAGGVLGMIGVPLPAAELGVAVSVVILGALLAAGARAPLVAAFVAAGAFGLYHGFAHGREMPRVTAPWLYALGFMVSTAGLHVMGALTGALVLCRPHGAMRLRVAGAFVGVVGGVFVLRVLAQATPIVSQFR